MKRTRLTVPTAIAATMVTVYSVDAAEIKAWFAGGVGAVTRELIPIFERSSGHKVAATYGLVGPIIDRVERGEIADAIIVPIPDLDNLQKQGKIDAGTRVNFAKTGIGVAVRAGAPKLDVSSIEAFKRALLAAKTIGYVDPTGGAGSSKLIWEMFERIGIAPQVKAKAKLVSGGRTLFEAITKQEVDMGVYIISEIVTSPGIELAGPLPSELQFYITYSAAVLTASPEPEPTKELLKFFAAPSALSVIKAKGMELG